MELERLAAFTMGNTGGNPAGVAFIDAMPTDATMLKIAADVGFSETAFLLPGSGSWRLRFFAPQLEVPFCGHATIASGAALGARLGEGRYRFVLNEAGIDVDAIRMDADGWGASLVSPPTCSRAASSQVTGAFLSAFNLAPMDLDPAMPMRLAHAGANHLIIPLATRNRLSQMAYPFDVVKGLMADNDITTVSLIWAENNTTYHARNAFAVGGVVEDPATGAAAAAFGGYLRDTGLLASGRIEILQGQDMGRPSRLQVEFDARPGTGVRVSGRTRRIDGDSWAN